MTDWPLMIAFWLVISIPLGLLALRLDTWIKRKLAIRRRLDWGRR